MTTLHFLMLTSTLGKFFKKNHKSLNRHTRDGVIIWGGEGGWLLVLNVEVKLCCRITNKRFQVMSTLTPYKNTCSRTPHTDTVLRCCSTEFYLNTNHTPHSTHTPFVHIFSVEISTLEITWHLIFCRPLFFDSTIGGKYPLGPTNTLCKIVVAKVPQPL